jgi:hypothetical protein
VNIKAECAFWLVFYCSMRRIPRLAEKLLAFQEGHGTIEFARFILRQRRQEEYQELYGSFWKKEVTANALTYAVGNVADN